MLKTHIKIMKRFVERTLWYVRRGLFRVQGSKFKVSGVRFQVHISRISYSARLRWASPVFATLRPASPGCISPDLKPETRNLTPLSHLPNFQFPTSLSAGLCLSFFFIFQPTVEATVFGNWKLNDNAGNYVVIDSNGGPNGALEDRNCSSNPNNTTSGVSRDGILGRAFCFDQTDNDSVETRSGIAGGDTTISIWFNTTTLGVTDTNWWV